jgi:hypothetical protein
MIPAYYRTAEATGMDWNLLRGNGFRGRSPINCSAMPVLNDAHEPVEQIA